MKNLIFILSVLLITVFSALNINGQCLNTIFYGSAIAPTSGSVTISTCNYQKEYSTFSSVVSNTVYECALSVGGYVTIRSGSSAGPVVAHGTSPLQWSSQVPGNHYAHWNTDSLCGTATSCAITTIDFISAIIPCVGPLPQTEPFYTGVLPIDWITFFASGDGWRFTGTPGYQAANNGRAAGTYAWIDFSGIDLGTVLETPEWCTGGSLQAELSFDYYADLGVSSISPFNLLFIEEYDGLNWNIIGTYQENTNGWTNKIILVNAYINGLGEEVIKVRFRGESGGSSSDFYQDILIDSVNIIEVISCTAPITSYFVTGLENICAGGSSTISISNTEVGVSYQLLRDGVVLNSPLAGTGNSLSFGAQTIAGTYTARGFGVGTGYCYGPYTMTGSVNLTINDAPTVSAGNAHIICSGSSTQLSGSASVSGGALPNNYGPSCAINLGDTYISNVTLNGVSTSSSVDGVCSDNTSVIINLIEGSSYALNVSTSDNSGSAYTHGISAYIDWNRDGDFDDLNEKIGTTTTEVNIGTYTFNFTASAGASFGEAMLRVVADEGLGDPLSTGSYSYGETEDYTINIQPVITYLWSPSTGLSATNIANPTANPIVTTTYTLAASVNGCSSLANVTVTVEPTPNLGYIIQGGGAICTGSSSVISINGSQTNVSYQLLLDGVTTNTLLSGTGGSLSFGSQTQAGTYTVQVFGGTGYCNGPYLLSGSATITFDVCAILGCIDPIAINYDPLATVDDGSCSYAPSTCTSPSPTGAYVTELIHDRARVNWDNMNDANCMVTQYRIRYRELGTSSWLSKTMANSGLCLFGLNTTSKKIVGLTASTTYEYYMKAWYCGGTTSAWSAIQNFTTLDECENVINFAVSTPTTTKASFTWDSTSAYSFARIKLREDVTAGVWTSAGGFGVFYPALSKNKNGLTPGTSYRAQARTWCDPTGGAYRSATWSPLVFWTQPSVVRLANPELTERNLLRITDLLGREINHKTVTDKTILLYIYDEGTVEKRTILDY
jgi:hypothetical protein